MTAVGSSPHVQPSGRWAHLEREWLKQWEQSGTPAPVVTIQGKGYARLSGAVGVSCNGTQHGMNPRGCCTAVCGERIKGGVCSL